MYINQRTQMFNTSILKNIQYGNKVSAKEVGVLLKRYKLDTVYSKLPQGVYTNAGVPLVTSYNWFAEVVYNLSFDHKTIV